MPAAKKRKPTLQECMDRYAQPHCLDEYSDSDSGEYENLRSETETIVTNYSASKEKAKPVQQLPTSTKIEKIPPIWLRNCPLQKIQQNIKAILDYEQRQQFPKLFPLKELPPLKFASEKEKALFLYRAEVAHKYIQDEERKRQLTLQNKEVPVTTPEHQTHEELMKWRVTMETILVQTCRRLEEFIKSELGVVLVPLTRIEYRQIQNMLQHLAVLFEVDFSESFLNFVRLTYRLPGISLARVQQVTKLYKSLQLAAKAKIQQRLQAIRRNKKIAIKLESFRQLTVKTKLKSIWNYDFEKVLIRAYRESQNFGYIKDKFEEQFPEHAGCFTANEIKDRFCSIIRAALRIVRDKLREQRKFGDVPKLFGLNEKRFKIISKSRLAIHLRLWLLDIYKNENCKIEEVLSMVDMMNEFVYTKENSQDTSSIANTTLAGSRVSNFTFSEEDSMFKIEHTDPQHPTLNPTPNPQHEKSANTQQQKSTNNPQQYKNLKTNKRLPPQYPKKQKKNHKKNHEKKHEKKHKKSKNSNIHFRLPQTPENNNSSNQKSDQSNSQSEETSYEKQSRLRNLSSYWGVTATQSEYGQ